MYPIGTVRYTTHGIVMLGDTGWVVPDGTRFDARDCPRLAQCFYTSKPRRDWGHPIRSWKRRRAWDRGERMAFGGSVEHPNLPNLRGHLLNP